MTQLKDDLGKDYYAILEVTPNACSEVIKAAYYAFMDKYEAGSEGALDMPIDEIKEAYKVVGNISRRQEYDEKRVYKSGRVIGNYRVTEIISKDGAIGATYKAVHTLVGELVCIKHCHRISSQTAQVLINEAKAMWDLRHYSIPAARDLFRMDDGNLALVMSYIPGMSLENLVKKAKRLDPLDVAWIMERCLNLFRYLTEKGVVHGAVRPGNIIAQPEHTIVVVDYGLAEIRPKNGMICKGYTDYFSPPEQIAMAGPLLPESDLYSLGMSMIYALSGTVEAVEKRLVPENVPEPMCEFIEGLICPDINDRMRWEDGDLFEEFLIVRKKSFGKSRSGMRPLPGMKA